MSCAKDGQKASRPPLSERIAADEAACAVITDIMARVSLGELRGIPMISVGRAGAFMCSALRCDCRACAIALNDRAVIIGEHHMNLGPVWHPEGLSKELLLFARRFRANKLILGTTLSSKWNDLLAFNEVYKTLGDSGVTMVDIIEVRDGAFGSVFKIFAPESSEFYKEFSVRKR